MYIRSRTDVSPRISLESGHGSELQMDFLQASWWGPDRGNDKFIREK